MVNISLTSQFKSGRKKKPFIMAATSGYAAKWVGKKWKGEKVAIWIMYLCLMAPKIPVINLC